MVKDGIVLGKRYAVLSKIGAGGMADVYKGRDIRRMTGPIMWRA